MSTEKLTTTRHFLLSDYRNKHKQLFTEAHTSSSLESVDPPTPIHDNSTLTESLNVPVDVDSSPQNITQACQTDAPNGLVDYCSNISTTQAYQTDVTNQLHQQVTSNYHSSGEYSMADTLLIGDSMVKHIDPNKLSRRKTIVCKSIPGAKIYDAFDITKDLVETHQVSEIIIHLGTNNLTSDDEPNEIVTKMASFCDNLLKSFTMLKTITISTIIPYLTWKTHRVNEALNFWPIRDHGAL